MENSEQKEDYWNSRLYDNNHSFVSKYGSRLVQLLDPKPDENILDIGCGTGDLAYEISKHGAHIIGIDNSYNMIFEAREKYKEIEFRQKNILKLNEEQAYDAIFSNATMHWIKQPKQALTNIYDALKPGGRFVAEFGGKNNVLTITNEVIRQLKSNNAPYEDSDFPWYFPSIGEYTTLMESVGFTVTFAEYFDRPTPLEGENGLRNWIMMFANIDETIKEELITDVENCLTPFLYDKGQWIADYKRIRVIGTKDTK